MNLVATDSLPAELGGKVVSAKNELNYFLEIVAPLVDTLPTLPDLLGDRVPRRYLICFKIRTSSARRADSSARSEFWISTTVFVRNFEIKNVYEIDGQLKKHFDPPEGFEFITGNWGVRDSNFSPDFPTSAAAAETLFEAAGFGSVDGVAAVNASFLETLVANFGGIKLERLFARNHGG